MEIEEFTEKKISSAEEKAKIAGEIAYNMGITAAEAAEAAEAIGRAMRLLPPIGEAEIMNIKCNPSLSRFQKWRLIREIKKGANNER